MRPMAIRTECYPGLERLVRLAVDLATPGPGGAAPGPEDWSVNQF